MMRHDCTNTTESKDDCTGKELRGKTKKEGNQEERPHSTEEDSMARVGQNANDALTGNQTICDN